MSTDTTNQDAIADEWAQALEEQAATPSADGAPAFDSHPAITAEAAAASGLEPRLPICTSPEAMAVTTSGPLLKRRQSIFSPMVFS